MGEDLGIIMAQLKIEIKDQVDIPEEEVFEPAGSSTKRSLRARSTSEDSLHRIRNRKVMKPRKNTSGALQFETEKEVKNFYLNINKKVKLKPILLETIIEKDETLSDEDEPSGTKDIGRKLKRTLAVCDGLNITKALKDRRKGLIKKHLGGKKRPKKMALAKFMEYFKQKVEEGGTDASNNDGALGEPQA
jgi:hypothetical protein